MNIDDIISRYNNIKFRVKLNNKIMEGIAKAIGDEAEQEIRSQIAQSRQLLYKNSHSEKATIDCTNNANQFCEEPETASYSYTASTQSSDPIDKETTFLSKRRDFDAVMDLMEELRQLEQNSNFNKVMSVVKEVFETNLDEAHLSQIYARLNLTSDFDKFKLIFFFALYFLFTATLSEFKEKKDNEVLYGYTALDLYIRSAYPSFGEWLKQAKQKYNKTSDIYTNPNSRQILKYIYNNIDYSQDLREENIIEVLMQIRSEILLQINTLLTALPETAIKHCQKEEEHTTKPVASEHISASNGSNDESSFTPAFWVALGFIAIMLMFCTIIFIK